MIKAFENSQEKKEQCIEKFQKEPNKDLFFGCNDIFPDNDNYAKSLPAYIRSFIDHNAFTNKNRKDQINCTEFLRSIPVGISNWTDILQQWFASMCERIFQNNIIQDHAMQDNDLINLKKNITQLDKEYCLDGEKWTEEIKKAEILIAKFKKAKKYEKNLEKYCQEEKNTIKRKKELIKFYPMHEEIKQIKKTIKVKLDTTINGYLSQEEWHDLLKKDNGKVNYAIEDITKVIISYIRNKKIDRVANIENDIKKDMTDLFFEYANLRLQDIKKDMRKEEKTHLSYLCRVLENIELQINDLKSIKFSKQSDSIHPEKNSCYEMRQYMANKFSELFKSTQA